jgi:hypothetical protein
LPLDLISKRSLVKENGKLKKLIIALILKTDDSLRWLYFGYILY